VVVGPCAREMGAREGLGQKNRNRAAVAQLRVRREKRLQERVCMGGTVVRPRWWWWWGGAFAKCEARSGWAKKTETERCGSVSGCSEAARGGGGCCGVTVPLPC
jgi:hypothetical protein